MTASSSRRAKTGAYGKRIALALGVFVLSVLLCDAAMWFLAPVAHPYTDPVMNIHLNLHPPGVVEFETDGKVMPGVSGLTRFTINAFGFRSPRLESIEKQAGVWRVFCIGGSTTECIYIDDDDMWTEQLRQRLQAKAAPGVTIDVVNTARSGDSTRENITMLAQRVIPFRPDVVIVMAGINDLVLETAPDYSPYREDQRSRRGFGLKGNLPKVKYLVCSVSQIARRAALIRRGAGRRDEKGNFRQDLAGKWIERARAHLARLPLEPLLNEHDFPRPEFEQNLRTLIAICRAQGIRIVLLTQPAMYRSDLTERERSLLWFAPGGRRYAPGDMARLLKRFNDRTRAVAAELDVPLVDLAAQLPRDARIFYDDCHFTVAGCAAVADLVAAAPITAGGP